MSRSAGMGVSHSRQKPKSGSSIKSKALLNLSLVSIALCNAASLMLLLLIASIRVSRPMALSGENRLGQQLEGGNIDIRLFYFFA
jgi:hypothetical protein